MIPSLPQILRFLSLVLKDQIKKKKQKGIRVSGMDITIGKTGSGKTIMLCNYLTQELDKAQKKGYPLIILTNFYWHRQTAPLKNYKQILEDYKDEWGNDLPVIFAIDEIQKEFKAQDFKNFPPELFDCVSEARKQNKRIVATAQYFRFVDNKFREYAHTITEMSNVFRANRLFRYRTYDKDDWTRKEETKNNAYPPKISPLKSGYFVADDYMYNQYDTYQRTESIRNRQYQEDYTPYDNSSHPVTIVQPIEPKSKGLFKR